MLHLVALGQLLSVLLRDHRQLAVVHQISTAVQAPALVVLTESLGDEPRLLAAERVVFFVYRLVQLAYRVVDGVVRVHLDLSGDLGEEAVLWARGEGGGGLVLGQDVALEVVLVVACGKVVGYNVEKAFLVEGEAKADVLGGFPDELGEVARGGHEMAGIVIVCLLLVPFVCSLVSCFVKFCLIWLSCVRNEFALVQEISKLIKILSNLNLFSARAC
jgi:hypothetical protein